MSNRVESPLDLFSTDDSFIKVLSGNEAYARGLFEAGTEYFSTYPGTPASEIGDLWQIYAKKNQNIFFDLSLNETVAFEAALGAAWSGVRSAVAFKHLGMNLISDALHTAMYSGIDGTRKAGLVIICGGDPDINSSTNAQDIRLFAFHAKIPIIEPSTVQECKDYVLWAYNLSELWQIPVLIYSPTRLNHASAPVECHAPMKNPIPLDERQFKKDFNKYVNAIHWAQAKQAKLDGIIHQIGENYFASPEMKKIAETRGNSKTTLCEIQINFDDDIESLKKKQKRVAFIASGIGWAYVEELAVLIEKDLPRLRYNLTYPIQWDPLARFIKKYSPDLLVIIEEQEPFIEQQIKSLLYDNRFLIPILGKNVFPRVGALSPDTIMNILGNPISVDEGEILFQEFQKLLPKIPHDFEHLQESLPRREPTFCPGCSHRNVFYALKKAAESYMTKTGREAIYGGDIGCYSMAMSSPYQTIDWLICMGAGVGIANGVARVVNPEKQHVVAMIGDSTFFHSGIQPIYNLIKNNTPITVIILDNYYSAMTGHQNSPSTPQDREFKNKYMENAPISIQKVIEAAQPSNIIFMDGYALGKMQHQFEETFMHSGVKFVIVTAECALLKAKRLKSAQSDPNKNPKTPKTHLTIGEYCSRCNECFERLGCTAIQDNEGQYYIDSSRCLGDECMSCLEVCPNHAIRVTQINPHLKNDKKKEKH
jgi:indolepyruvate ferredoxin oxidoreductase alpha subunit